MSHWYSTDAKAQHFIEGANGKQRASTLRDARKFNWLPSVTEIINTLDKPALVNWKIKQVLLAALTLPHEDGEGADSYYTRVMKDAFTESNNARDKGLEIHATIERIWKDIEPFPYDELAQETIDTILSYCGGSCEDYISEQIVVGDGYGGKVDLHNDDFVIDYKTKEISDADWDKYCVYMDDQQTDEPKGAKPPKLHYDEMCMQLAAYDVALDHRQHRFPRKLINVFVDRNIPGRVIIHEWSREEAVLAFEKFGLLVKYWCLSKNYYPQNK